MTPTVDDMTAIFQSDPKDWRNSHRFDPDDVRRPHAAGNFAPTPMPSPRPCTTPCSRITAHGCGKWPPNRALDSSTCGGPLNNIALEQRKSDPNFTLVPDSVHPGPAGHVVMAMAIIHDLGLPRQVSSIRITLDADKQHQVDADGRTTERPQLS